MKGLLEAIKLVETLSDEEINFRLNKALEKRDKNNKNCEEFEVYLPIKDNKEEINMENISVFTFEDGKLVKKDWYVSDNKEGEYDEPTIKNVNNYDIFKNKCMKDVEIKKEYDRLQPEYDKIKENMQKEIDSNMIIIDSCQDLIRLINHKTSRGLCFDIDLNESMMSFYVRSGGRNMRIILQDVMLGFEDPNKYLSKLVDMLYSLGFNVKLSERIKEKDRKEFERLSK